MFCFNMVTARLSSFCAGFLVCECSNENELPVLALMCTLGNSEILNKACDNEEWQKNMQKPVRINQSQSHVNVSGNWKMCPWFQEVLGF